MKKKRKVQVGDTITWKEFAGTKKEITLVGEVTELLRNAEDKLISCIVKHVRSYITNSVVHRKKIVKVTPRK